MESETKDRKAHINCENSFDNDDNEEIGRKRTYSESCFGEDSNDGSDENDDDLASSTPLKFIKGENGKKTATATEEKGEDERKRKLFSRNTDEAKMTFFGFDPDELKRFIEAQEVDFKVVEEGGNYIKCVCRCNDAFPTQKSFLRLNNTVCEENRKSVGVMMDEECAAALPKTPRINTAVFDLSYYPNDDYDGDRRGNGGFKWFGLSWIFNTLSGLFR